MVNLSLRRNMCWIEIHFYSYPHNLMLNANFVGRESSFQCKKLSVVALLALPDLYRLHARRTLINMILKTTLQREDEAMAVVHFWMNIQYTMHEFQQFSWYHINIGILKKTLDPWLKLSLLSVIRHWSSDPSVCIVLFTKYDSEMKLSTHWVMYRNTKQKPRVK